jgi:GNAT superfamily N-acetyltransferase
VRRLTAEDAELFKAFEASATEQDLDDAYVELDHWRVFGALVEGKLVAAASMYPWDNSKIADMGVLTLPEYRGQGHGKAVVQALAKHAYELGYEPQYRHQSHNLSSKGVALGCGFEFFGQRDVVLLPE